MVKFRFKVTVNGLPPINGNFSTLVYYGLRTWPLPSTIHL